MKWRKINYALHRDIGYLCIGLTLIYAISGIALNHINDWNPSYKIVKETFNIGKIQRKNIVVSKAEVDAILEQIAEKRKLKNYHQSDKDTLNIFLEGNNITINLESGHMIQEISKRRFLLFESNFLHLNHPKKLWTYVADVYAIGLFLLAFSGLLMIFGTRGIKRRGAVLSMIGFSIPIFFLILYM